MICFILAQSGSTAANWLNSLLWISLILIFLSAIVGAIVRLRVRDKCLKLLHDYHVSYLTTDGTTLWGDLLVYAQGLELCFDAPFRNRRDLVKSSALIYDPELVKCLAICRVDDGLTQQERQDRLRQVKRTFSPGFVRRMWRGIRNIFNTLRDAVGKSFSVVVGHISRTYPAGVALAAQTGQIDQISQTILGVVGNAYEPMLERHLGDPVVLQILNPADPAKRVVELPGYLVDYSNRFVAVFNVKHEPVEVIELELTESLERPDLKAALTPEVLTITCLGPDVLVVKHFQSGERSHDLAVPLLPGASIRLSRADPAGPVKVRLDRTRQIDVVCPRAVANVRFGGEAQAEGRKNWLGLAPEQWIEHWGKRTGGRAAAEERR